MALGTSQASQRERSEVTTSVSRTLGVASGRPPWGRGVLGYVTLRCGTDILGVLSCAGVTLRWSRMMVRALPSLPHFPRGMIVNRIAIDSQPDLYVLSHGRTPTHKRPVSDELNSMQEGNLSAWPAIGIWSAGEGGSHAPSRVAGSQYLGSRPSGVAASFTQGVRRKPSASNSQCRNEPALGAPTAQDSGSSRNARGVGETAVGTLPGRPGSMPSGSPHDPTRDPGLCLDELFSSVTHLAEAEELPGRPRANTSGSPNLPSTPPPACRPAAPPVSPPADAMGRHPAPLSAAASTDRQSTEPPPSIATISSGKIRRRPFTSQPPTNKSRTNALRYPPTLHVITPPSRWSLTTTRNQRRNSTPRHA
jgi:hypothetical protein